MNYSSTSDAGGKVGALPPDVQNLVDLGLDVIPVAPGSKDMIDGLTGWQKRPPAELWSDGRVSSDCNRALRHGGELRLASVEVEHDSTPEQAANVTRYLAGLGLHPDGCPVVNSYRGFPRFFLRLLDAPAAGSSRRMHADFGAGEFRFGAGAFALIPDSRIEGKPYTFVGGDWRQLPPVYWADIAPLLADGRRRDEPTPELSPTPTSAFALALEAAEREIANLPRSVYPLLEGRDARTDYASTEEQRIMAILANAGKSFDAALLLFQRYPCFGHFSKAFARNPSKAIEDLRKGYDAARQWTLTPSETVQRLAEVIARIEAQPFAKRTGISDTAVLLAHLRIAHDAGVSVYAAGMRRVAELAGVERKTAERATGRLLRAGQFLDVHREAVKGEGLATVYSLRARVVTPLPLAPHMEVGSLRAQDDRQNPSDNPAERTQVILAHDCFAWRALGKSAGLVYAGLLAGPGTVAELAERSARHPGTVKRALVRMSAITDKETGEVYPLAEETEPGIWQLVRSSDYGANLDHAARLLGAAGIGERRIMRHELERTDHAAGYQTWRARVELSTKERQMTPQEVKHALKPKPRRKRRQ